MLARTGSISDVGNPGPRCHGYRFPTTISPSHGAGFHDNSFPFSVFLVAGD